MWGNALGFSLAFLLCECKLFFINPLLRPVRSGVIVFFLQLTAYHYSKKAGDGLEGNPVPLIVSLIVLVCSLFRLLSETRFYYCKYYYTLPVFLFYGALWHYLCFDGGCHYVSIQTGPQGILCSGCFLSSQWAAAFLFYFLLRCHFFQSQGCIFAGIDNECKINSQGRHLLGSLTLAHEMGNWTLQLHIL